MPITAGSRDLVIRIPFAASSVCWAFATYPVTARIMLTAAPARACPILFAKEFSEKQIPSALEPFFSAIYCAVCISITVIVTRRTPMKNPTIPKHTNNTLRLPRPRIMMITPMIISDRKPTMVITFAGIFFTNTGAAAEPIIAIPIQMIIYRPIIAGLPI